MEDTLISLELVTNQLGARQLASSPNGQVGLFLVTPRRPALLDFYKLDKQHKRLIERTLTFRACNLRSCIMLVISMVNVENYLLGCRACQAEVWILSTLVP